MADVPLATIADLAKHVIGYAKIADRTSDDKEAAIGAASGKAYGYLAERYTPPFTLIPLELTKAVCQIAGSELHQTDGFDPSNASNALILRAEEMAISWLKDVGRGTATLTLFLVSETEAIAPVASPSAYSEEPRGF